MTTTEQMTTSLMKSLDNALQEYRTYIYMNYLNKEEIPLFMREFYSDSPSWFLNRDIQDMKDTIQWSSRDDNEKREFLDDDLDDYFKH
jgi:hypothetical protein